MDCSSPGSSVHGIFQARILDWVAISYSRGSFWPRDQICTSYVSCIGRWILYHCPTWEAILKNHLNFLLCITGRKKHSFEWRKQDRAGESQYLGPLCKTVYVILSWKKCWVHISWLEGKSGYASGLKDCLWILGGKKPWPETQWSWAWPGQGKGKNPGTSAGV